MHLRGNCIEGDCIALVAIVPINFDKCNDFLKQSHKAKCLSLKCMVYLNIFSMMLAITHLFVKSLGDPFLVMILL